MATDRYDFGRNWSDFSKTIDSAAIDKAQMELVRLTGSLKGKTFLDIGCGSGIHSLAALRAGASKVVAVDYDPKCIDITQKLLETQSFSKQYDVRLADVLDQASLPNSTFDIVYSWGVLHHTGDMWRAIENCSKLVNPNGRFALALYLRTPFCWIWRFEKRIFALHKWTRPIIKPIYSVTLVGSLIIRGRNPLKYIQEYKTARGMNFWSDIDDWLGGYPYESVTDDELTLHLQEMGFKKLSAHNTRPGFGLLGTGCGEWLFHYNGE